MEGTTSAGVTETEKESVRSSDVTHGASAGSQKGPPPSESKASVQSSSVPSGPSQSAPQTQNISASCVGASSVLFQANTWPFPQIF